MQLTTEQLATLKQWVIDNHNGIFDESTVTALNAVADPAFLVFRDFVPMQEIMANGFDWTRVDNLNVGKARIWEWMERSYEQNGVGGLNPSKETCREGINAIWVGTAADRLVRDVIYTHCYRSATVAEKLFATGNGTAPVANGDGSGPGTMGAGASGDVTLQNVIEADA